MAEYARVQQAARLQIVEMRMIRAALDRARDRAAEARHWLELNMAVDRFADLVGGEEKYKQLAEEVSSFGVTVRMCEFSDLWVTEKNGYDKYLELLPRGSRPTKLCGEGVSRGRRAGMAKDCPTTTRIPPLNTPHF